MAISTPPAAPNPLGTNFAAEALAFTQWMHTAAPEFNTAVSDANQAVLDAQTDGGAAVLAAESARDAAQGHATDADTARGLAVTAQGLAEDARDAAQGFAGGAEDARDMAQTYAALAGASAGLPALAGQALKNLRVKSNESGVEWSSDAASAGITRTTKTGAYTLAGADKGAMIDCTGTWTLGLTAAATLGAGWWCYVRNIGTGTITADPDGSELIDGVTSGAIRPGMTLLIQCDGTAFHCVRVGPHVAMEALTSGTSWTVPLGVRVVKVRAQGPGSSGAIGSAINQTGTPGAAGGYSEMIFSASPGDAATYVIGAAGAAASSGTDVNGNAGGNTRWALNGVTITVNGGDVASPAGTSAIGGSATGGTLNIAGRSSSNGVIGYGRQHGPSGVLGGYGAGGWGMTGGSTGNSGAGGGSCIVLEY